MKDIAKILFVVFSVCFVVSCSDDFLETDSTKRISEDRITEVQPYNAAIYDALISGLYSTMFKEKTGYEYEKETDNPLHDDYGQKSYDIYTDLLSGDMMLGGYNYRWYKVVERMTATVNNSDACDYMPWRYYYRIIRSANAIIDGLGGVEKVPETDKEKWQLGQALTMRAYCYFYLAYMYSEGFDPDLKILPIYTSTKDDAQPLSTVTQVWNLIKSDLETSVELLQGYSRGGIQEVNADVANGFLAYTYLTMGEYEKAIATAQKVIDSYSLIPKDKVAGGDDIPRNAFSYADGDGAKWIWGMDLTLNQGLDLVSWWGHVDIFTYSYAMVGDTKLIDLGLYNSIRESDVRKEQFVDYYKNGKFFPVNKFYHEARTKGKQREVTSDYIYMRVEEMYLVKAEAEAFNGNDPDARATLLALVKERDSEPDYVNSLAGQDLKDEIYKQWRIEMWGEGKSYFAMKRNKATITREGHIDLNISIPYNDDRLTFDIPYKEIQDNPNISF
jgi:hypothetical protein